MDDILVLGAGSAGCVTKADGEMDRIFDIVIVGAGSAGCVLANRLSADPHMRVLLLEAGGWDWNPLISIPIGARKMTQWGLYDWGDVAEPDPGLNDRRLPVLHGKVVGGGSSVNYMAHTRGHRADYDGWVAGGAPGWGYDDLLPHLKACETWEKGENAWRGGSGELGALEARPTDPIYKSWLALTERMGLQSGGDYNAESAEGVGPIQYTIKHGQRASAAATFLRPALSRPNLTVATGALVTKVLFEGRRAIGVQYLKGGQTRLAHSTQRTILSLGAINTPQLLMLSGVGPADHLRETGIDVVADLPVGQNLEDHLGYSLYWTRPKPGHFHASLRFDRVAMSMLRAYLLRTGPGSNPPGVLLAYLKSRPEIARPDLEFILQMVPATADYWFPGVRRPYADGYGIKPYLLSQQSRGEVLLRSSNPADRPRIFFNSLSAPEDLAVLRESFKKAWDMGNAPELAEFRGEPLIAAPKNNGEIDAFIRANASQQWHPGCTCRMGEGPGSVVDPSLNVHGLEGLSIMDASVMPSLVSGNPNVPIIAMASKAAAAWRAA